MSPIGFRFAPPSDGMRGVLKFAFVRTFGYGVLGMFLSTGVTAFFRAAGLMQADFIKALGIMIVPTDRQAIVWVGYSATMLIGGVCAWLYQPIFRFLRRADWASGMVVGVLHWFSFGLLFGYLSQRFPRMQEFMPMDGPFESLGGFGELLWVLGQYVFYGGFVGASSARSRTAIIKKLEKVDHGEQLRQAS